MELSPANRVYFFHIGNSHTVAGTQLLPRLLSIHPSVSACTTIDDSFDKESQELISACVQSTC